MRSALFRPHRAPAAPRHLGWIRGEPVRFFASTDSSPWPWVAVHDLFAALQIPTTSWPVLIHLGRETAPASLRTLATGAGIVVIGNYGFGRAMIELCSLSPGFEGVVDQYNAAMRATSQARAG